VRTPALDNRCFEEDLEADHVIRTSIKNAHVSSDRVQSFKKSGDILVGVSFEVGTTFECPIDLDHGR
jgi:hypothetical protein